MECVKGRTYVGTTVQITFHPTNLTLDLYIISNSSCVANIPYTVTYDKSTINFSLSGVAKTLTNYTGSGSSITYGSETLTYSSVSTFTCSPVVPIFTIPVYTSTCTTDIFDCVKGKEFYGDITTEFFNGITIKFDTTRGRLFLGLCTGVSSNLPPVGALYTSGTTSITVTSVTSSIIFFRVSDGNVNFNASYIYTGTGDSWSIDISTNISAMRLYLGDTIRIPMANSIVTSNTTYTGSFTNPRRDCGQCYLIGNYVIDTVLNLISFTWTSPINNKTYSFCMYAYNGDGITSWSLSLIVKYSDGTQTPPGTIQGSPTQVSKMVSGACSVMCLPDSVPVCPTGTGNANTNNVCSDGSIAKCFSMCVDSPCPPPFTETIKFANIDDFSQKIVIQDANNITIGGTRTVYFLRSGQRAGEYFIDTPYCTFYYSFYTVNGKKVASLITNSENGNIERYIDVCYYFYKKTLVKPVAGSTKTIRYDTTNCTGDVVNNEVEDSILYHCLMFSGIDTLKYYILKKSTVTLLQQSREVFYGDPLFNETIDQILSPYENLKKTDVINGTWSIIPSTEELIVNIASNVPNVLLEEYGHVDFMRHEPIYTSNPITNIGDIGNVKILYENELFYFSREDSLDVAGSPPTYSIVFKNENQKISNTDYEYLKITRKDSDVSCLVKRLPPFGGILATVYDDLHFVFRECDYSGNYLKAGQTDTMASIVNLPNDISVRFSFMRPRTIDKLSLNFTLNITDTGDAGDFFLYDSQLLSGLDGYNTCSTNINTGTISSTPIKCIDVYDASSKCEETNNAVGFTYNFSTNYAQMILFDEQFDVTTNRGYIVGKHNDLSDTYVVYNNTYYQYNEATLDTGIFTAYYTPERGLVSDTTTVLNLTHNIFPSEKIAPITIDNTRFLGEKHDPYMDIDKIFSGQTRIIGLLPGRKHIFLSDQNNLISYKSTQTSTYSDYATQRVFIRSNQPNIGGKIFRGVHFKNTLPTLYTGKGGYVSTNVQINTTNNLELANTNLLNMFLIHRVTNYEKLIVTTTTTTTGGGGVVTPGSIGTSIGTTIDGTTTSTTSVLDDSVNLFLLGTADGVRFINYKYEDVGIVDEDCYWYIVKYDNYPRKLYLLSFVDNNIVIELDLNSDFVFPSKMAQQDITVRLNSTVENPTQSNEIITHCVLDIDGTSYVSKYEYVGNRLILYTEIPCSDEQMITKAFSFYIDSNGYFKLIEEDTKNVFNEIRVLNWQGPFVRVDQTFTSEFVQGPSYTNLDAVRDAAKSVFVPPAAQGNKDFLDNFLYALQFVPLNTPFGTVFNTGKRVVDFGVRQLARQSTRIPRIANRLPPRRPINNIKIPPASLSIPGGVGRFTGTIRTEKITAPINNPIRTEGSSITKFGSKNPVITKPPLNSVKIPATPISSSRAPPGSSSAAGKQSIRNRPADSGAIKDENRNSLAYAGRTPAPTYNQNQSIVLRPAQQNSNNFSAGQNMFTGKTPDFLIRNWERQNILRNKIPATPL
jgi:hypothetical protein